MFNSVKKAISGIFGTRVVAKPRRNVIALPTVDTAAESEAALVDARRGLLATLEAILQGKKDAESEAIDEILDLLHEGFCDGDYCSGNLILEIESLKLVAPRWSHDDERWGALAAAIEYFAGCLPVDVATIEYALKAIERGDYRYITETPQNYAGCSYPVEDDESLGMVIADEKLQPDCDEWDYLSTYFDFETCGRDYRTATNGKFTQYGFFAEF